MRDIIPKFLQDEFEKNNAKAEEVQKGLLKAKKKEQRKSNALKIAIIILLFLVLFNVCKYLNETTKDAYNACIDNGLSVAYCEKNANM